MLIRKLEVEFEEQINTMSIEQRKYTLTHSDETGQRYLFVGRQFADSRCNRLKDEVLAQWVEKSGRFELHIRCNLYCEQSLLSIEQRYVKFKEHMPRAIAAIVNGDMSFIIQNGYLEANIYVHFLSAITCQKEFYGKIEDYIRE